MFGYFLTALKWFLVILAAAALALAAWHGECAACITRSTLHGLVFGIVFALVIAASRAEEAKRRGRKMSPRRERREMMAVARDALVIGLLAGYAEAYTVWVRM